MNVVYALFLEKSLYQNVYVLRCMVRNRFSLNLLFLPLRFLIIIVLLLNISIRGRPLVVVRVKGQLGVAIHRNLGGVDIPQLKLTNTNGYR